MTFIKKVCSSKVQFPSETCLTKAKSIQAPRVYSSRIKAAAGGTEVRQQSYILFVKIFQCFNCWQLCSNANHQIWKKLLLLYHLSKKGSLKCLSSIWHVFDCISFLLTWLLSLSGTFVMNSAHEKAVLDFPFYSMKEQFAAIYVKYLAMKRSFYSQK